MSELASGELLDRLGANEDQHHQNPHRPRLRTAELGHPAGLRLLQARDRRSERRPARIQHQLPQLPSPHKRFPALPAKQKGTLGPHLVSPPPFLRVCRAPSINGANPSTTSGLALVPIVRCANYCASKAALHHYILCLREQLRGSSVNVVELFPPAVQSMLHRVRSWLRLELGVRGVLTHSR